MVIRRHWTLDFLQKWGKGEGVKGKGMEFSLYPFPFPQHLAKVTFARCLLIILPHTQKLHATSGVEFFILKPWKALQPCEHEMKPQAYETSFLRLA